VPSAAVPVTGIPRTGPRAAKPREDRRCG
jgi:hypothetical protein